ncbi:MAG: hypothetical protein ACJAS1_004664 [Oleiphilaceae bacterium]|jgi:hypothetical protein
MIYHAAKEKGLVNTRLTKLAPLPAMQERFGLIKMSGKIWVIDKVAIKKAKHLELFDLTNASLLIIRKVTVLFGEGEETKLLKAFVHDIICNGDDVSYQYLFSYMAHAIQKPEEKSGVMLILFGGQGIGKGTFGRIFQILWKESYLQFHSVYAITGNFNATLENSFIVFMDEALLLVNTSGFRLTISVTRFFMASTSSTGSMYS